MENQKLQGTPLCRHVHTTALPQAAVHHPWWRGGCRDYKRFWGWAVGDGALLDMYPSLAYRSWPSATELGVLLAAAAAAAGALWTVTAATLWAAACLYSHCGGAIMAPAPGLTAGSTWAPTGYSTLDLLAGVMAAAAAIARRAALCGVAIRGADMLLDVWRNCCLQVRALPCSCALHQLYHQARSTHASEHTQALLIPRVVDDHAARSPMC